ncbi:unnamed protein product [Callosobruchus maculatus]|uniref:Uncharacterized protein n=1 Tax=Callosobruchus maculatus TaxID=64391 RepID=A0A653BE27_CALMS|nr:unnamed protein product [Callosobruchus maculatus]
MVTVQFTLKGIMMPARMALPTIENVVADHPFIVLLQATKGNLRNILFQGQIKVVAKSARREIEIFVAEHSFVVLLQANNGNLKNIIFQGRIAKPQ